MTNTIKTQEAMERWQELAFLNCETDYEVNELLETIAGEKYNDYEELDDPIWTIINRLSDDELDAFIIGCQIIEKNQ